MVIQNNRWETADESTVSDLGDLDSNRIVSQSHTMCRGWERWAAVENVRACDEHRFVRSAAEDLAYKGFERGG